jgi:hypothetical protein
MVVCGIVMMDVSQPQDATVERQPEDLCGKVESFGPSGKRQYNKVDSFLGM